MMLNQSLLLLILISISYGYSFKNLLYDIENIKNEIKNVQNEANEPKIWAVLAALSSGWSNYRHQANVLHAYKLLSKMHKIPKEQIILMMYDDIAQNERNPFRGKVFSSRYEDDLYTDDIEKDYTGKEVNPENFLKILTRDEELINRGKKVLGSTRNDYVFIYTTGHGHQETIFFPNYEEIHKLDLQNALKSMKKSNYFSKLAIYVDACHSGSMFDNTDPIEDVFAITSAHRNESSYDINCDERPIFECTASEFGNNWIMDSYKEIPGESLFDQYINIKKMTNYSHVQQYGDLLMAKNELISNFLGKGFNDGNN